MFQAFRCFVLALLTLTLTGCELTKSTWFFHSLAHPFASESDTVSFWSEKAVSTPVAEKNPWSRFSHLEQKIIPDDTVRSIPIANYDLYDSGDMLISIKDRVKREDIEIFIIKDKFMLAKTPQRLVDQLTIDVLDWPVLNLKTLLNLLYKAAPDGPDSIDSILQFDIKEHKQNLLAFTPAGKLVLYAPLRLRGTIKRLEDGGFQFDFVLHNRFGSSKAVKSFGIWRPVTRPKQKNLTDSFPLVGWQVFRLSVRQLDSGNLRRLDYLAIPVVKYKTLGELRAEKGDKFSQGVPYYLRESLNYLPYLNGRRKST